MRSSKLRGPRHWGKPETYQRLWESWDALGAHDAREKRQSSRQKIDKAIPGKSGFEYHFENARQCSLRLYNRGITSTATAVRVRFECEASTSAPHSPLSSPGLAGRPSTPRLLGSITWVSGILDRPIKSGDDSEYVARTSISIAVLAKARTHTAESIERTRSSYRLKTHN
jgi:hypothetical protein